MDAIDHFLVSVGITKDRITKKMVDAIKSGIPGCSQETLDKVVLELFERINEDWDRLHSDLYAVVAEFLGSDRASKLVQLTQEDETILLRTFSLFSGLDKILKNQGSKFGESIRDKLSSQV